MATASEPRISGHISYIFAFDLGYEMSRTPIVSLLGQKVEPFQIDPNKRAPRQLFFYRPQLFRLPFLERIAAGPLASTPLAAGAADQDIPHRRHLLQRARPLRSRDHV